MFEFPCIITCWLYEYIFTVQFHHHIILSFFLSWVCLILTFLCATIIVNSHLLRPSSSKGLIQSFLLLENCISFVLVTRPSTQVSPTVTLKEVIRPQVPLRPPCYDFSLVADPRFDNTNMASPRQEPTSMKRRAVCARSRDVFTARWWHAVTRDSIFMRASFSPQS